jgi:hypothetical protein
MRRLLAAVTFMGLNAACGDSGPENGKPADTSDPACQIQSQGEASPGYPFNIQMYTSEVLPLLSGSCASAGCHGPPQGTKGFTVWPAAAPGNCDFAKTFNTLTQFIDLNNPDNSSVFLAVNGALPSHPVKLPAGDPKLATLKAYITDAAQTFQTGGGGRQPAPPGASPFDYNVYQQTIQPMLDNAGGSGCSVTGCHGTGAAGFTLKRQPAAGSADMEANFLAVTQRTNLASPATSLIYVKATTTHGGGSPTISATEAQQLLAWISAAGQNSGGQDPNCAPVANFNAAVFRDEILPILRGEIDLNNRGDTRNLTGCTRAACHGADRPPGSLVIKPTADPADALRAFACFVNTTNPVASEILLCPLDDPRCRRNPHPGQEVFSGADDLNYQRILAYIYSAAQVSSPLDFAFFVRRVNPIFNDLNAVEGGAQGRTCADTQACHGVNVATQSAPNGSNFPLIPNAGDPGRLTFNFVSAASFVNFLNPQESSLFLYPTNEIADVLEHPLATGLPHPGGTDFAVDSREAQTILAWAAGLRPDAAGFQRNWLVAGDYPAAQITDLTFVDERTAAPKIFDPTGAPQFNNGQWEGLFSDAANVDLNLVFPRAQTTGRVAFAAAYIINISPVPITAQMEFDSQNALKVYVAQQAVAQSNGGPVAALATLPPGVPTRVLVKVFQRANDAQFAFSTRLRDEFGNLLTDQTGELVIKLSPDGGI